MPTKILKLTAAQLKEYVNPTDDPALFRYGNGPRLMPESAVDRLLQTRENNVLSALPEHYRDVASGNADGVYLTDVKLGAAGGETDLQLPFVPAVDGSVLLYKNYTANGEPWESRTRQNAMTPAEFTVDETTGEVLLTTPLSKGDSVIVEYRHDAGATFLTLVDLVLCSARLELYSRFTNWNDATNVITEMREVVDNALFAFNQGDRPQGISEIDDVKFVIETRKNNRNTMKRPYMRGAL